MPKHLLDSRPPACLQRTLEELFIKGPIANTRDNPEFQQVVMAAAVCDG